MEPYDFSAGDWRRWTEDERRLAEGLEVGRIRYARFVNYVGLSDTREADDRYVRLRGYE